ADEGQGAGGRAPSAHRQGPPSGSCCHTNQGDTSCRQQQNQPSRPAHQETPSSGRGRGNDGRDRARHQSQGEVAVGRRYRGCRIPHRHARRHWVRNGQGTGTVRWARNVGQLFLPTAAGAGKHTGATARTAAATAGRATPCGTTTVAAAGSAGRCTAAESTVATATAAGRPTAADRGRPGPGFPTRGRASAGREPDTTGRRHRRTGSTGRHAAAGAAT